MWSMNDKSKQQALTVLGLGISATKEEIKQTFHRLAAMYHPDVNGTPEASEYYLCISSAYEYLMSLPDEPQASAAGGYEENAVIYHGNVAVGMPQQSGGYESTRIDRGAAGGYYGAARIIGSRESLSQAATRRAFKEEHRRQEVRLKRREEERKKAEEERLEQERRQRIFDEAMARIHAIRAAEITASIIEDVLKNGSRGKQG